MPLYLFQLGVNALEELFARMRTLSHQNNMDIVQFGENAAVGHQFSFVLTQC